jgi:hypothetical protein
MNLVLLTATVNPNVSEFLSLADPAARLAQYQLAIREWHLALRESEFRLAIVETSNATAADVLALLSPEQRSTVSFVNYNPSGPETERGKGAIEISAIRHTIIAHPELRPNDTIYKCTGRLPVKNAMQCIDVLPPGTARARMSLNRSMVDTRLFGATSQVWEDVLFGNLDQINDSGGVYYEHVVAAQLSAALAVGSVSLSRFPNRPIFAGVSGTSGRQYAKRLTRLKYRILRPLESALASVASRKQV